MGSLMSCNKEGYYTLYPRICRVKEETTFTLRDRFGLHELPDECIIQILPVVQFENRDPVTEITVASKEGGLSVTLIFDFEQEYLMRLLDSKRQNLSIEFSLYALENDLFSRRPYKGDLHMHTNRSDGMETPAHILSLDAEYAIAPFTSFQTEEEYVAAYASIEEDFETLTTEKPWLHKMGKKGALELLHSTKINREKLLTEFEDPAGTIDAEGYVFALDAFEQI